MGKKIRAISFFMALILCINMFSFAPFQVQASPQSHNEWYGYQVNGTSASSNEGISKLTPETSGGYAVWGCYTNLQPGTYQLTYIMKVNKSAIAPGKTISDQMVRFDVNVTGIREIFPRDDINVNSFAADKTYQAFSADFTINQSDLSGSTAAVEMRLWSNAVAKFNVYKVIISDPDYNTNALVPTASQTYTECDGSAASSNGGTNEGSAKLVNVGVSGHVIWGVNTNLAPSSYKVTFIMSVDKSSIASGNASATMARMNPVINGRETFPKDFSSDIFQQTNTYQAVSGIITVLASDVPNGSTTAPIEVRLWSNGIATFRVAKIIVSDIQTDPDTYTNANVAAEYSSITASSQYSADLSKEKVVESGEWASLGETNPWVQLNFTNAVTLNTIVLQDRSNTSDHANSGIVSFSDGTSVGVTYIPTNGNKIQLKIPLKSNITWLRFQAVGGTGSNVGLAEVEAYNLPNTILPQPVSKQKYGEWDGANTGTASGCSNEGTVRVDPVGVGGYASWDCHVNLLPGIYKLTYIMSVDVSTAAAGTENNQIIRFNPVVGSRQLFPRDDVCTNTFTASNTYQAISADFRVLQSDLSAGSSTVPVEGRIWSNGVVTFRIQKVIISDISYDAQADGFTAEGKLAPKADYRASTIYAINTSGLTKQETVTLATLQGLAAKTSSMQIYTSSNPAGDGYLNDLKNNYNVTVVYIDDLYQLLTVFKNYCNGYILFHMDSADTDSSLNAATSLAGPYNAIAVDDSIENNILSVGITNRLMDVRGKNESWVFSNYWSMFRHDVVFEQRLFYYGQLRDYATALNAFMFYDYGTGSFRNQVLTALDDSAKVYGWFSGDEYQNISEVTKYGASYVASDYSTNLSILSGFDSNTLKQQPRTDAAVESNVHYVTFIMSDGDNEQLMAGGFLTDSGLYGSQYRGNFNVAWPIPPAMYDNAPTILKKIYDTSTSKDQFILSPSGSGYMYPSRYPASELNKEIDKISETMSKMDVHSLAVFDQDQLSNTTLWDKYTSKANIDGLFYFDYSSQNKAGGSIVFSNNKPVISCRELLWSGLEEESTVISNINGGSTNIHSQDAYSVVYVHVWSKNMNNINTVVQGLNSNVRVVSPEQMINLVKKNIGDYNTGKVYEAEQKTIAAGVGSADAAGWKCTAGTTSAGYIVNGASITDLPAGQSSATFNLKVDSLSDPNQFVANLQVYDASTSTVLSEKAVKVKDFDQSGTMKPFQIDFIKPGSDAVQLRCWWYGKVNVTFDKVSINSSVTYEAEGASLSHMTGQLNGDGWAAATGSNSAGHMIYGPYTTTTPVGKNSVLFRMLIDNNTADNNTVASIDVYDSTQGKTLASQTITRQNFLQANVYQDFRLDYTNMTAGDSLEFRVYWNAAAYIKVDKIISNSFRSYVPANMTLSHNTGRSETDGWSASTTLDQANHMIFGPYAQNIPTGSNKATFTAMIDSLSGNSTDTIITVEVYNAANGTSLASSTIKRSDFSAANTYKDFTLAFNNTAGNSLEFRVYWYKTAYVKVDKITVSQNA